MSESANTRRLLLNLQTQQVVRCSYCGYREVLDIATKKDGATRAYITGWRESKTRQGVTCPKCINYLAELEAMRSE